VKAIVKERKTLRPRAEKLSDREIREQLKKAESLYVLGINSAYVEQARKAVEARFGRSPKEMSVGEPLFKPAFCVKMSTPCRAARLSDIRMQFFFA
jgi:hypothetical protein